MKIKNLLLMGVAALALCACSEGTNEYHSTYFYPLKPNGVITYADQTVDSTRVVSYDSWSLSADCSWLEVSSNGTKAPLSVNVPAGYMSSSRLDLKLEPNTTGQERLFLLQVVSSFEKIGTVVQTVMQYPYLNITTPGVTAKTENNQTTYSFSMDVPASGKNLNGSNPYLTFIVYADGATLASSDESWLQVGQTDEFTKYTQQTVPLTVQENTTGAPRTATLTLTSNGVSTTVTVNQAQ